MSARDTSSWKTATNASKTSEPFSANGPRPNGPVDAKYYVTLAVAQLSSCHFMAGTESRVASRESELDESLARIRTWDFGLVICDSLYPASAATAAAATSAASGSPR